MPRAARRGGAGLRRRRRGGTGGVFGSGAERGAGAGRAGGRARRRRGSGPVVARALRSGGGGSGGPVLLRGQAGARRLPQAGPWRRRRGRRVEPQGPAVRVQRVLQEPCPEPRVPPSAAGRAGGAPDGRSGGVTAHPFPPGERWGPGGVASWRNSVVYYFFCLVISCSCMFVFLSSDRSEKKKKKKKVIFQL